MRKQPVIFLPVVNLVRIELQLRKQLLVIESKYRY